MIRIKCNNDNNQKKSDVLVLYCKYNKYFEENTEKQIMLKQHEDPHTTFFLYTTGRWRC